MTIIKEGGVKRRKNDFYETPLAVAAETMFNIPCEPLFVKKVLDPGAGRGVWGKALRLYNKTAHITGIDIQSTADLRPNPLIYNHWVLDDYLDWKTDDKFDLIMGNPPYKLAHEFVDKSLDLLAPNGQLVFLLRLAMLESLKRYKTWWTHSPIYKVLVSTRRISFTNDRKTDDTAYAIFMWREGWDASPTLGWLHWNYDNVKHPVVVSSWDIPVVDNTPWYTETFPKEGKNEDIET